MRYQSHIRQIVRQKQLDSTELGRLPTLVMDLVQQGLCSWLRRWQGSRASRASADSRALLVLSQRTEPLLPHHDATLLFSYHSCRLWALGLALPYTQLSSDGAAIRLASVCREASLDACAIVVSQGHCMSTLPVNSSILVVYASVMALKVRAPARLSHSKADAKQSCIKPIIRAIFSPSSVC